MSAALRAPFTEHGASHSVGSLPTTASSRMTQTWFSVAPSPSPRHPADIGNSWVATYGDPPAARLAASLGEFVELYLAQRDTEPEAINKLRWLLGKATAEFGELPLSELAPARSPLGG